ncbi:cytochrome c oxidase subunit 3 [Cytophagaceae bacterium DM2B3-1]|uniref:Cytochrome c oxidase subunit 3 n=1 Tax=Xanthocytophaga flava TaxID=3048013 RepID=A0ABT7CKJ7_9BACT|nr:cytochrome c oxidase subunit 3 [Xanthocytophaga flavus]MDJ1469752.1 cytochrome c oxidase subunit 3 [Xanthocytophaga flavus]MDJ1494264.1 cytochrome c oxidase subunit 3 [Xanthocytophaga flavus]
MAYKSEQQSAAKPSLPGLFTHRKDPYQFMLYLGFGGSSLIFLLFVVLYIIRKGTPGWLSFNIPSIFWISTSLIILSSITLHLANKAFIQDRFTYYKWLLAATLDLGILFIITQIIGWQTLLQEGIVIHKSTAGAFLYIISGLHLLHVLGGLVFLSILLIQALKRTTYIDSFIYSVNPPNQFRLLLISQYWHFVDILWVLLFIFFLYQQYF